MIGTSGVRSGYRRNVDGNGAPIDTIGKPIGCSYVDGRILGCHRVIGQEPCACECGGVGGVLFGPLLEKHQAAIEDQCGDAEDDQQADPEDDQDLTAFGSAVNC
ncbi:MAG: hypothetical protein M3Y83_05170 [Actinomycetota bacterium]|nr:hypothetical protein [Actinomycetota bacterium]